MENLIPFTLFGSGVFFGIMLVAMFIVFIISDINEDGVSAFIFLLITIGLNYFWGNFPILEYFNYKYFLMYLFIGFIFSIIRTYFKGKELSPQKKEYFNLKEHVFRWWFMWFICLINWVFGTLLADFYNFIYKRVGWFYQMLFNAKF